MTTRLIAPRFAHGAAREDPPRLPPVLAVQERQRPFIEAVEERLRTGAYKLRDDGCPCGTDPDDVVISETDRYGLPLTFVLCMACGTIRINPYLDEDSLADFYVHMYQQMYRRTADLDKVFAREQTYGRRVLESVRWWLPAGGWVYEAGCGGGGALKVFQDAGYRVAGSDYSEELIAAGRGRGVTNLHMGSTEALIGEDLPGADLVYLHHVLEHSGDPVEMLRECGAALASGGRIVVIVPDVGRIGDFPYPGGDLMPFLHIAHKFNFSDEGLRRAVERAGFRQVRLTRAPEAAEMWMEITPAQDGSRELDGVTPTGRAMLHRLKRTERLHRMGLCPGQLRRRRDSATAWLMSSRVGRPLAHLRRRGKEAQ